MLKNSVTNRLAKQLKKAKVVSNIFLTNVHQQSQCQLERVPNALGAENFHAAMTFATQTSVEFTKDIVKSFPDRCRTLLTHTMSNAPTLFKHFARRKWRFFTFTKSFASYNEFVDSKRFSRLLRTDLPLRLCLYDSSNSRYIAGQSFRIYYNSAWRLYSTTSSEWWTMCLKDTRIYSVWLCRRGRGISRFARIWGQISNAHNSKTVRARPIIMVR